MKASLILFLFCCKSLWSQDLIVTTTGDSIHCYIYKKKKDFVYYSILKDGEERKSIIPMGQVLSITYDWDLVGTDRPLPKNKASATKPEKVYVSSDKFLIAANTGLSYTLGKIDETLPTGLEEYLKDLRTGYHFSGDIACFLFDLTGLGFKYSMFRTRNSTSIQGYGMIGNIVTGKLSDNITVQYIGPAYYSRYFLGNGKFAFLSGLSIGYLHYKNSAYVIQPLKLTGESLGLASDIGIDAYPFKNLGLGIKVACQLGALGSVTVDDGKKATVVKLSPNLESLSRIDLSFGARLIF